jgi:hypothetical protein
MTNHMIHVLYCSGTMCVGVTVWFGWGGVVSLCRMKHCFSLVLQLVFGPRDRSKNTLENLT